MTGKTRHIFIAMNKDYVAPYRRSYFRYIVEVSSNLITENSREKRSIIVKDVCPRGIGIFIGYPIQEGEEFEVEIIHVFGKPVIRKAKVIWCEEVDKGLWRAGLDFGLDNLVEMS